MNSDCRRHSANILPLRTPTMPIGPLPCFAADAAVHDERQDIVGREAIRTWATRPVASTVTLRRWCRMRRGPIGPGHRAGDGRLPGQPRPAALRFPPGERHRSAGWRSADARGHGSRRACARWSRAAAAASARRWSSRRGGAVRPCHQRPLRSRPWAGRPLVLGGGPAHGGGCAALAMQALDRLGGIDILVDNVGGSSAPSGGLPRSGTMSGGRVRRQPARRRPARPSPAARHAGPGLRRDRPHLLDPAAHAAARGDAGLCRREGRARDLYQGPRQRGRPEGRQGGQRRTRLHRDRMPPRH